MFPSIKMEEYMEPELSGIFWVKMVAKNMVLGSPGTHFMHKRVMMKILCAELFEATFRRYHCMLYIKNQIKDNAWNVITFTVMQETMQNLVGQGLHLIVEEWIFCLIMKNVRSFKRWLSNPL